MIDWRIQYWDSSLFHSFITGQEIERVNVIRALLDIYDKGGITIVISTFVIAEVRRLSHLGSPGLDNGQEGENFNPERQQRIREVMQSDQLVIWSLIPHIGELAARIGNQHPALMPADCVHIATALHYGVDVLFTYDGVGKRRRPRNLRSYDGQITDPPKRTQPLPIREPFIPAGPLFEGS